MARATTARRIAAGTTTLVAVLAVAPVAGAAEARSYGSALLTLEPGRAGLQSAGVRVQGTAPARATSRRRVGTTITSGRVASSATVRLGGTIRLRRGSRTVSLSGLDLKLGKRSKLTGRVGGSRRTIGSVTVPRSRMTLDRADARVSATRARVRLTAATARLVRKRLRLRRTPTGTAASLTVAARLFGAPATPGGAPTAPPGVAAPGGTTPGGPGPGGPGTPSVGDLGNEPPVAVRPADAVDVRDATFDWDVRESFIRYINSGEGTTASDGATPVGAEVREGSSRPLDYRFRFTPRSGWRSPGGSSALTYAGKVRMQFSAHGIDLTAADPEVEIQGTTARVIVRLSGTGGTAIESRRIVLLRLAQFAPTTAAEGGGVRYTYADSEATIYDEAAANAFAGFYTAGEPFGKAAVSFVVPD